MYTWEVTDAKSTKCWLNTYHQAIKYIALHTGNRTDSHLSWALGQPHSKQGKVFQHLTAYRTTAHLEEKTL